MTGATILIAWTLLAFVTGPFIGRLLKRRLG